MELLFDRRHNEMAVDAKMITKEITEDEVYKILIPIYEESAQRRKEYREFLKKNFPMTDFA